MKIATLKHHSFFSFHNKSALSLFIIIALHLCVLVAGQHVVQNII